MSHVEQPAISTAYTANTVSRGRERYLLFGGVEFLGAAAIGIPIIPAPALRIEIAHGIGERVDLRWRYDTVSPLLYSVGVALRVRLWSSRGWAIASQLQPRLQLQFLPFRRGYFGGAVSTQVLLVGSRTISIGTVVVEAGATVQWLAVDIGGSPSFVDRRPGFASLDLGIGIEWPVARRRSYALRFELAVVLGGTEALALLGTFPRLMFGGIWGE